MTILKINLEWKKTKNNQNTRRQFHDDDEATRELQYIQSKVLLYFLWYMFFINIYITYLFFMDVRLSCSELTLFPHVNFISFSFFPLNLLTELAQI